MTNAPSSLLIDPASAAPEAVPIIAVAANHWDAWLAEQSPASRAWLGATNARAEAGAVALLSDEQGRLAHVVLGLGSGDDPWVTGALAKSLPKGIYRIAEARGANAAFPIWAALAWALGGYSFSRYKSETQPERAQLLYPEGCDRAYVARMVDAICLTRDLVNTPAGDLLPDGLEQAARNVASRFGADVKVTVGDDLLTARYPLIHAVGRASAVAPRLIDLTWGKPTAPKVTLVGKGVCFDSGGLDLKSASGMALMKKDMGGAATALGLAQALMAANAPIRLRLLISAVENAVSGNAFRPGDVLQSRKGLSVEIGNTDAEGRLVLADALTDAVSEQPALVLDFATLTGAARTALGPELPAMFTDDEKLADDLLAASRATNDPLWRLPLWAPYRKMIDSKIADINNAGDSPFAGAITAALFLKDFATTKDAPKDVTVPWAHFDLYAWNATDRPGRPVGGEALCLRAVFELIRRRFG